jgi:uncharacterized protein with PhoU and TrkA domain
MADRAKYLEYAAHCVAIANKENDPAEKLRLLEMAQTWTRLADYADEITTLVEEGKTLESLIDRFLKQVSQVFTLRVFDFRTTS